jgi:A/G-specific adenine glycosylase
MIACMERRPWTIAQRAEFRQLLLSWYSAHARDLPWRQTRDPYRIWISEVMLQQTRVATVIERYTRFTEKFPSLLSLALARQEDVLALWSGLGYYKRARLLHDAARLVVAEYGGSLPQTAAELRKLPGVGAYTAPAIASIAYSEPIAVVDGNVERVLIRLLALDADGQRPTAGTLQARADELLDPESPGIFNQAMMELGATICLPRAPLCTVCPVYVFCRTRGEHPPRPRTQIVSRQASYLLWRRPYRGQTSRVAVLLVQRPEDAALMPGMWELPEIPEPPAGQEPVLRLRHAITNSNYYVSVFTGDGQLPVVRRPGTVRKWVPERKLNEIPLTGLARKILMRLDIMAKPREVRRGKALPGDREPAV